MERRGEAPPSVTARLALVGLASHKSPCGQSNWALLRKALSHRESAESTGQRLCHQQLFWQHVFSQLLCICIYGYTLLRPKFLTQWLKTDPLLSWIVVSEPKLRSRGVLWYSDESKGRINLNKHQSLSFLPCRVTNYGTMGLWQTWIAVPTICTNLKGSMHLGHTAVPPFPLGGIQSAMIGKTN